VRVVKNIEIPTDKIALQISAKVEKSAKPSIHGYDDVECGFGRSMFG
jgi:hypothetical protein